MRAHFSMLFLLLVFLGISPPLLFPATEPATMDSPEINESSGIVKSRQYPDIFWTHNDSDDSARIFAIRGNGKLVGIVEVVGAKHVDWEDIAMGESGEIYICDIGDNRKNRDDLAIYLIPEPDPKTDKKISVTRKISFHYQIPRSNNPAHFNAEACFFVFGNLYILTKEHFHTELYRIDLSKEEAIAERVSTLAISGRVTGADVTPDGKTLAVLTYLGIHLFEKPKGSDNYLVGAHKILDQFFGQTEGIAFDNGALVITNEEGQILKVSPSGGMRK
jgi:hypothetical protein